MINKARDFAIKRHGDQILRKEIRMNIKSFKLKSNGWFSIVKEPYDKKQHPNQQQGLDKYVDVLNHCTGNINSVKLYENKTGLHFKADGGTHYLSDFVVEVVYVPFQILDNEKE